jgi:hypothetical protein
MRAPLLFLFWLCAAVWAAAAPVAIGPENRLMPDAPAWRDLAAGFAAQADTRATFEERRHFPFRREPVVLGGDVRVSRARGLSLHYTRPEARTVILDDHGVLVRGADGREARPDPRAEVGQRALLLVLRMDFAGLEKDFEVYGRRDGEAWALALMPRDADVRRSLGTIHVTGAGTAVRTLELRRSARQHIDIAMSAVETAVPFTADEVKRFFR